MIVLQSATRLLAFIGKELVEVVRRPGAIISLILGPFLIMAIFGIGYQGYRRPLQTILVVPPQAGIPADMDEFRRVTPGMEIVEVTGSPEEPLRRLAHLYNYLSGLQLQFLQPRTKLPQHFGRRRDVLAVLERELVKLCLGLLYEVVVEPLVTAASQEQ